ncbi:hypothetical protein KAZ82_01445 [Candidatus Babeliales bacterium]|nr:hypothetical protein [Candidatus Babeliales bacterium]
MNNYQIFFHAILVTILLSLQTAFAAEVKPKTTEEDLKIIEQFVILPAKLKSVVTQHILRLTDENVERIKKGLSPIIIFHNLFFLLAQLYKNEIDVLCDSEVLKIEQYKSGAIINIYNQLAFVLNTMSGDSNTLASRIFKLDENFTQEQYCQVVCFAVRSALPISFDIKNTNIVFQLGENWIIKFGECLRKYMVIHFPNNICDFSLISLILSEHTQYPKSILMVAVMEIQNELLTLSGDVSSSKLEILAIRNRISNKIQEIVNRKITFNKSIPTCNFEVLKHTCLAHHGGVNICYVNSFGHTIRCHSLELIILINYLRKNLKILIDTKYKQYSDQDLHKCAVIGDNALKFFDAMFKNFFDNIVEDPAMTESELEIERKTLWQIFFAMIKNAIDKLVFREIDFERFDYHAPGVQIIVSNLKEQFNQFRFGLLINTFEAMHNEIIKNEFAVHKTMYADFCRDKNLIIKINSKFQQLTNDLIEEERLGRIATDRCEEIEYRNQMLLGHTIQECLIRTEEENQ